MKIVLPAREIDAIEWTGENLREVQEFILPHSPYLSYKEVVVVGSTSAEKIGVPVADLPTRQTYSYNPSARVMAFINVGDRIVRVADGMPHDLAIITRTEWERMFPLGLIEDEPPPAPYTEADVEVSER